MRWGMRLKANALGVELSISCQLCLQVVATSTQNFSRERAQAVATHVNRVIYARVFK